MKDGHESFDSLLQELQLIKYHGRKRGYAKSELFRKSQISRSLAKINWKRFLESSDEFASEYYHLFLPRAIQESPIHFKRLLSINPRQLGFSISELDEVSNGSILEKQIEIIIHFLEDGNRLDNLSYWKELLDICAKRAPLKFSGLVTLWCKELCTTQLIDNHKKKDTFNKFCKEYGRLLDERSNQEIKKTKEVIEWQLQEESNKKDKALDKIRVEFLRKSLTNIIKWSDEMDDQKLEECWQSDKDNNEILLTYDMESAESLYKSLGKQDLFIAIHGDEIQFESKFHILIDINNVLNSSVELLEDDSEFQLEYLESLSKYLIKNRKKGLGKIIKELDPQYPDLLYDYLCLIGYESENEFIETGFGLDVFRCYFIKRNSYKKEIKDLREFCKILYNHTEEYFSDLLNDF